MTNDYVTDPNKTYKILGFHPTDARYNGGFEGDLINNAILTPNPHQQGYLEGYAYHCSSRTMIYNYAIKVMPIHDDIYQKRIHKEMKKVVDGLMRGALSENMALHYQGQIKGLSLALEIFEEMERNGES